MTKLEQMAAEMSRELRQPRALAEIFCQLDAYTQATFFSHVASIASEWKSEYNARPSEYQAIAIGRSLSVNRSDVAIEFLSNVLEGTKP